VLIPRGRVDPDDGGGDGEDEKDCHVTPERERCREVKHKPSAFLTMDFDLCRMSRANLW
jgi:hypothetical protein